jgi:hypothetical protein
VIVLHGLAATASAASAQTGGPMHVSREIDTPRAEVTAAVLFGDFEIDRREQKEFPDIGWSLSINANISARFALVGEVNGYANYYTPPTPRYGAKGLFNQVHDLLAGSRVQSRFFRVGGGRHTADIRVFGQVLGGIRVSEVVPGGRAIQPGAGVDFFIRSGITIRDQLDYCFVRGAGHGLSGSRALVGIVFGPS